MKKRYIILILCFLIYLLIALFIFGSPKKKKSDEADYILFANNQIWKYSNSEFFDVLDNINIVGQKKFYIYDNGTYKGYFNLGLYESKIYLFDDDDNSYKYDGELMGFTDNNKHKVVNLLSQQLDDNDTLFIQKEFNKNNLEYQYINLNNVNKYVADIDNDGENEIIYNISNMLDEEKQGKGYSLIFINDSDKIYELIKDIKSNQKSLLDGYGYYMNNIADLNGDGKLDFIIAKSEYGSSNLCYMLIESVKNKYKITKKC